MPLRHSPRPEHGSSVVSDVVDVPVLTDDITEEHLISCGWKWLCIVFCRICRSVKLSEMIAYILYQFMVFYHELMSFPFFFYLNASSVTQNSIKMVQFLHFNQQQIFNLIQNDLFTRNIPSIFIIVQFYAFIHVTQWAKSRSFLRWILHLRLHLNKIVGDSRWYSNHKLSYIVISMIASSTGSVQTKHRQN